MSNQLILWGTLILPWLTLIFMPKADIKRYISVGLLSAILCILVTEIGFRHSWWAVLETTYPFSVMPPYAYSLFPIMPMWLLKYTFGRFGLYFLVDTFFNLVFSFVIMPWFARRGIISFDNGLLTLILQSIIAVILYGFQKWQQGIYLHSGR